MTPDDPNLRVFCDPCDREKERPAEDFVYHGCGYQCDCVPCFMERLTHER